MNTFRPQFEYVKLADRIADEIREGRLPVGARLPGEREMCEVYGVGIGTARRAVRELRERGLVETLRPKGTYVIAQPGDRDDGVEQQLEESAEEPGTP